ncbi:MAG: peptidoglycan-binding protein, partial [bacterium]|nr:peptidoglycan-binding protein [bacterium]
MKIKLFGVASVMLFVLFIPLTTFALTPQFPSGTITVAELMQQIAALQVQIEELKADLANTKQEVAIIKEELRITKTLRRGMTDEEVKKLQEFLSMMPEIYPEGLVTGYFGPLTEKAVKKWQEGNGIESVGIVGPKTRAKLSEVTSINSSGAASSAISAVPTSESGVATVPAIPAQPGENQPTATPSGTTTATPAQPIGQTGVTTVSAIPATPAQPVADTTPPTISNIQATNITQTTAVISWTTNEVSTCDVYYARNSSVLTNETLHASIAGNVTNHSITLSNLVTYSGYYYLVVSKDEAGNTSTSSVNQFLSLMEPVVTPTTRTITATAGTGGTISPDGSVVVTQGADKTFTITPNAGYTISAVMVDGVNQGAIGTYTFTNVQTTHTISATFAQVTYAITVTQGANGTISPGTTSVVSGGGQAFVITPATGYQIASVSVDGVSQGAISTYTFTNVTSTHSITATFSLVPVTQCVLTVSIAQTSPAAQNINPGQSAVALVKFNATSNCDGTLNSFAVSLLPMPNGYQNISALRLYNDTTGLQLGTTQSVTIAGMNFPSVNTPLTANQTLVLRVVGDVSPSAVIGSTVYGTFGGSWAVNGSGGTIGNNASGNLISGNTMTVTAIPVVQYNITVTQGANGTISPGTTSVTSGGSQTFTLTPSSGYQILNVTVDGVNQGAISTYTFTNV